MRNQSKKMALGGVTAALAVVIMSLGTLIPVATYACPTLCMLLLARLLPYFGKRISWAWYGAVALLSLLLAPDKEAAAVFLFLGYYPIVKPLLDKTKLKLLWKLLLFNVSALFMYFMLINVLGLREITQEFEEIGTILSLVLLLLGNVVFFSMDRILTTWGRGRSRGK